MLNNFAKISKIASIAVRKNILIFYTPGVELKKKFAV